jgi:2-polyprenyl-6-methoxyphenol hydroxylase-like FAD-dependent oxidoreductase
VTGFPAQGSQARTLPPMMVPVLIAGGGPVGMTLALELARRGINCTLVERNETTTRHPKMDITNARSMELFRRLGLSPALRAAAVPETHNFDVSWVTTMTGRQLHRFQYPSVAEARQAIRRRNDGTQPVEPPMRVSQVEIEPVLKRAIEEAPQVNVRFGVAFESLTQSGDGVTAVVRDTATGTAETIRCRYLVGCDGGGSIVRQCLGTPLSGDWRIMQRFMTHFRSNHRSLLQRWGTAWHYQSPLGTLIAQNDRDLWTLHSRAPDDSELHDVDPAALLRLFIGADIVHQVEVANRWSPHLLVANAYRNGRAFLAGDAVHQYIPTGGYGMNTGIGDACDLGWKLAAVLHGFAQPGLLDSYEAERRPVGLRNREGSRRHNETRRRIAQLYRDAAIYGGPPPSETAMDRLGREIAAIGNAENESGGIELGYSYAGSSTIDTDPDAVAPDDPGIYQPSTVPGVRLPSVMLGDGTSTHDRLDRWFTLMAFGCVPSRDMVAAAGRRGVPLAVVSFHDDILTEIYGRQQLLIRPDQHIAWRGTQLDVSSAEALLDRVTGTTSVRALAHAGL